MEIKISFVTNDPSWDAYILKNAAKAASILADESFLRTVSTWRAFDYTNKSAPEVAAVLRTAGTVVVRVDYFRTGGFRPVRWFRAARNRATKAIASEKDGVVSFNRAKKHLGAGSPGNIAHEAMHVLGFKHNGNERSINLNTVPYRIGEWVDDHFMPSAQAIGE